MLSARHAQLAATFALALIGCAPPLQQGGVIVLPGATERLILAMRMGYLGVGDAKPPAAVRTVAVEEDRLGGDAASGRDGDIRLENQSIAAIVAQIGGPRGGTLVDLARKAGGHVDELGALEPVVAGAPVRYETLKVGTDDATRAAFALVTGHPDGHPEITVSTRYDVAPELDAVLVHTSITVDHELPGPIAIGDVLSFQARPRWASARAYGAAFQGSGGYALKPLVDLASTGDAAFVSSSTERSMSLGLAPSAVPSGTFVYSRMVAPLDRPDSLSLASALAAGDGDELGEVDLEIVPEVTRRGGAVPGGVFVFADATDATRRLELLYPDALHLADHVTAKVPAGDYRVSFDGAGFRSPGSVTMHVVRKQLASSRLVILPATLASPPAPALAPPSPAPSPAVAPSPPVASDVPAAP